VGVCARDQGCVCMWSQPCMDVCAHCRGRAWMCVHVAEAMRGCACTWSCMCMTEVVVMCARGRACTWLRLWSCKHMGEAENVRDLGRGRACTCVHVAEVVR
jgi:hypothetical protein